MKINISTWLKGGLCTLLILSPLIAKADFPDRPITLVIPFSAGGGTDVTGRLFARSLEKHAGRQVVVVNKTGAGGEIGMGYVANSKPDGYTIGILNTPNALTIPIERKARFSLDSFQLLANLVDDPATLSVKADSSIRSVKDLVAKAKSAPGTLTYGTAGIGSAGHISMMLFEQAADVSFRHIPFKGTTDVIAALMGGHIDIATANLSEALGSTGTTSSRILGLMRAKRSEMASAVPTFAEEGYPIVSGSLRGLGAPANIPKKRLAKLQSLVEKAVNDPEFLEAAKNAQQQIHFLTGENYKQTIFSLRSQFSTLWNQTPWNR